MGKANTRYQSADSWKQKYLTGIARLRRREKQWAEIENLLRLAVWELSLAADGVDPILDDQLVQVRGVVRNAHENARFSCLVDEISQTVKRLNHQKSKDQPTQLSSAEAILQLLDSVTWPPAVRKKAQQLRERLKTATGTRNLVPDFAHLMADALACAVEPAASVTTSRSPRHGTHEARQDRSYAVSRLQGILLQVLDYMALPEDLLPQARALEDKLTSELNEEQLSGVLQQIADLVSQLRNRVDKEKQEIEAFLIQLTERLRDLGQHLQVTKSQERASFDSGRELDEVVRHQVQHIEHSVHRASNLEQLKLVVQQRLESIRNDLDIYRRSEQQSHARMEREVETLTSRLQQLENECTELRERAKREHMQAVSDALTGIFNRPAYETRLAQEYARWKRYRTPFALMLWDVDGFKFINDTYGHTVGDNVLKLIAGVLKDNLRDADFIARYGGDEFAALLSETDLATAMVVAEKLRANIGETELSHRGARVPITLSCGIASIRDGDTPDVVFERADAALYRAKHDGKNRCEPEKD